MFQEAFRTPKRHNQESISPHHILVKMLRLQTKETVVKVTREKHRLTYKSKLIRRISALSVETLSARKFNDTFQTPRVNNFSPNAIIASKIIFYKPLENRDLSK